MTGYTLTGLATDADGNLADPRINFRSPLLTGTATLDEFLAQLTGMDAAMARDLELAPDEPARSVVHHGGPGGIPGVLVIRPVTCPSWHRIGDVLDRASVQASPPASELQMLTSALWPYSSEFMDADTGRLLDGPVGTWAQAVTRSRAGLSPVDDLDLAAKDALAGATTGFATFEEASRRVVAAVPSAVRTLITWGRLFTDPATVADLRPALYTWWE